jgi:hypothetical protein
VAVSFESDRPEMAASVANRHAQLYIEQTLEFRYQTSSEAGKWLTENRNTYQDYLDLYREEPPKVAGVRIQINSQHTDTSGESYFADVVFKNQ